MLCSIFLMHIVAYCCLSYNLCVLFVLCSFVFFFFFSSRRRHTRCLSDWSSDVCSSDLEGTGGVPQEFAEVRVLPEGVVEVPIGAVSQGQGHETVFAQVVAERLGLPFDAVRVIMGDTDRVAKGVGTFASRSMVRAGSAAVEAAAGVVAAGRTMAAHLLEAAAGGIGYDEGAFRVVGTDRSVGIFDLARAAAAGQLPPAFGTTLAAATMHENPAFAFANGCEACEVEVDPETGAVEVVALTIVDDSGRSVNPLIVHGQT